MRVLFIVALYTAIVSTANADTSKLDALKIGDMRKLQFHTSSKPIPKTEFIKESGDIALLSSLEGKVVLLNFWATWCAPCRKEMPQLSELQRLLGGDDFEVLTIATGRNDPVKMQVFFDQIGINNLPLDRDPKQSLARAMGLLGLPASIIIDRGGHEVARMLGDADWNSDSAIAIIKTIIAN